MLPRERVLKAFNFEEADRIPWGEHLIDFNIFEDVLKRPSYVNSHFNEQKAFWEGKWNKVMEHYKRDIPELTEKLELDIVTLPGPFPERGEEIKPYKQIDSNTYSDSKGDIYKLSASNWLLLHERNMENYSEPSMEELDRQIEEIDNSPEYDISLSSWDVHRYIVKEMKDKYFIMGLGGGLEFPRFGATEEDGWINLILQPEKAKKVIEIKAKKSLKLFRAFARLGFDGVIPCGDLGNSKNLSASPGIYREIVYPWSKIQADEARKFGMKVVLHSCGHIWPVLPDIARIYDGYEAIQGSAGMDIVEVKEKMQESLVVWGGIMHEHLISGTPKDIRNDARHSFPAARGGGFILGSSHSLAVGAKLENVLEMKKCRDEWGKYPIGI